MTDNPPSLIPPPTTLEPLDEAGGHALVEAWRASGLTGAAYCRAHKIRPQRLHYWRERLGYPIKIMGNQAPIAQPQPSPPATGFVQVVVDRAMPSTTAVDIVVGGAIIRVQPGFDAPLLRSIIEALRCES